MRLIDHLLAEPIHDTQSQRWFDKKLLLGLPPVPFVVDNVAKQLIVGVEHTQSSPASSIPGMINHKNSVLFSAIGHELLFGQGASLMSVVAAMPPYESCFFEYEAHWKEAAGAISILEGVWLLSGPAIQSVFLEDAQEGDPNTEHVVLAYVFNRYLSQDGINVPINDCQGSALIKFDADWDLVRFVPDPNMPNRKEILVALASLMLLGTKTASAVQSATPPVSKKQRRKAKRDGTRVKGSGMRFWTLKLNVPNTPSDVAGGAQGGGGWTMAWHRVRGHLRRLKSGKVVKVRPHTRGDLLKGVVEKNYELKMAKAS